MNEKIPVNSIFSNLPALSPDEYDELFNDFTEKLNQNHSEELEIAKQKQTRLKLVRALLSICALGTKFSEDVYSYTLDFVLRKELCLTPISLN